MLVLDVLERNESTNIKEEPLVLRKGDNFNNLIKSIFDIIYSILIINVGESIIDNINLDIKGEQFILQERN